MDLSGISCDQIRAGSSRSSEGSGSLQDLTDILDLSGLDLENEETWLYEPTESSNGANVPNWVFDKSGDPSFISQLPPEFDIPKLKSTKMIDTRTFTRPKKKYTRPSINDIEKMYFSESDANEMNSSTEDKCISSHKVPQTVQEEQESIPLESHKPLQFDLSQPTSLHNFDSFMFNSAEIDSFQNMSPPSLVNSLCSSTFANLMDSSFIKNDPVLREIRDKDFTETAMLQDIEAPMFQSITGSLSSLNSDTPENFLKKVSRDNTFRRNISVLENNTLTPDLIGDGSKGSSVGCNATFANENCNGDSHEDPKESTFRIDLKSESEDMNGTKTSSSTNLNGTYRRTPKHHGTFRKADLKNNRFSLNLTYEMANETTQILDRDASKSIENDMNTTNKESISDLSSRTKSSGKTVIISSDSMEELKKKYSSEEGRVDLNRISYCQSEKEDPVNTTYTEDHVSSEVNRTVEIKRSSLGSADSLDRMSSLSSSSKGSNCKVLSMEDVQAIVEMQERSLSQVMSTPKGPVIGSKTLWEHNFISPIVSDAKDHLSDSDLSDDYKSVNSQQSSKVSLDNWKKPSGKILSPPVPNKDIKMKTSQRSAYTLSNKPLQALPNSIRGSYSNISTLKSTRMTIGGSHQNLYRPPSQTIRPPSTSNLNTIGTKLKGSYTSLKPISANLPVAPPIGSTLNGTQTITRPSRTNKTVNVVKMPVEPQSKVVSASASHLGGDGTFVKPQNTRTSGLPRPTGIPRPASRIPGPRSSNIR